MRWKKNLIALLFLWSDKMDIETIEVFQNSNLGGTNKKVVHFDKLRHLQKTDVNRGLLIDFFKSGT